MKFIVGIATVLVTGALTVCAHAQTYPSPSFQNLTVIGCSGYMFGNVASAATCNTTIPASGLATGVAATNLVIPLVSGNTVGAASTNITLINNAISAAFAQSSVSAGAIVLPAGDYYFSGTIVPQSGVKVRALGVTMLHYTGVANAVENTSSIPLTNFFWENVGLDAGVGANGVIEHSGLFTNWKFSSVAMNNASGTFFSLLADIAGNNAAFNKVDGLNFTTTSIMGTAFLMSGTGTPTVLSAVATLNTIGDINVTAPGNVTVGGIVLGHWTDTNTFVGQQNIVVGANNANCLYFNNSADATKTVYNTTMEHVSCAQYTALTGTTAINLGYTRTVNISALFIDEFVGTQFATPLKTSVGTSSYYIVNHGNDPFGVEQIVVWQQYIKFSGGPGVALIQSLPITWSQAWNNAAVTFTAYNFDVTDTASQSNSILANFTVGGVSKVNFDKAGDINAAGGVISGAGVSSVTGYSVNSVLGFTGTKTAGACTLTISGGIITAVAGC